MALPLLTDLEKQAMKVKDDEYANLLDGEATWVFSWMGETRIPAKQLRGIMSSLEKKGLIIMDGSGKDASISYTKEGREACKMLNKVEAV